MGAGSSMNVPKLSQLIQDEIVLLRQQETIFDFEWTPRNRNVWQDLHKLMDKGYARTDYISLMKLATICINLEAAYGTSPDKMVFYRNLCRLYRTHKTWAYHWLQDPDFPECYEHSVQAVEILICLAEMKQGL